MAYRILLVCACVSEYGYVIFGLLAFSLCRSIHVSFLIVYLYMSTRSRHKHRPKQTDKKIRVLDKKNVAKDQRWLYFFWSCYDKLICICTHWLNVLIFPILHRERLPILRNFMRRYSEWTGHKILQLSRMREF